MNEALISVIGFGGLEAVSAALPKRPAAQNLTPVSPKLPTITAFLKRPALVAPKTTGTPTGLPGVTRIGKSMVTTPASTPKTSTDDLKRYKDSLKQAESKYSKLNSEYKSLMNKYEALERSKDAAVRAVASKEKASAARAVAETQVQKSRAASANKLVSSALNLFRSTSSAARAQADAMIKKADALVRATVTAPVGMLMRASYSDRAVIAAVAYQQSGFGGLGETNTKEVMDAINQGVGIASQIGLSIAQIYAQANGQGGTKPGATTTPTTVVVQAPAAQQIVPAPSSGFNVNWGIVIPVVAVAGVGAFIFMRRK